jgi:chromosome segregation ATPase
VKTLLQELKESQPASDARVKTWLQQLEDKVNLSATITKEELSKLQGHFAYSHGDMMHLLEAKLGALDLLSLEPSNFSNTDNTSDLRRQLNDAQETITTMKKELAEEKVLRLAAENKISGLQTLLEDTRHQSLKENHAKEQANARQRFLEEQFERETSKSEALQSSVEALEKENKRLQDALKAIEEKYKQDMQSGKVTVIPLLSATTACIKLQTHTVSIFVFFSFTLSLSLSLSLSLCLSLPSSVCYFIFSSACSIHRMSCSVSHHYSANTYRYVFNPHIHG